MSEGFDMSESPGWDDFVLERFAYNYKSDTVHWKAPNSADGYGAQITGTRNKRGYKRLYLCGTTRYMHQIVWVLVTGKKAELQLDHIDGDTSNNAYRNLREVSQSTNLHNNTGKGYSWNKRDSKWQAKIVLNNKAKHLGYFNTPEEARAAYEAAKKLHGFIHR